MGPSQLNHLSMRAQSRVLAQKCDNCYSEMPPVVLGFPWPALRSLLRNHFCKKKRPQPVLGGREFWKCSGAFKCLEYRAWGIPAVLSRGIPGKALRAFPGFPELFWNFFRKVPAVLGVCPSYEPCKTNLIYHLDSNTITDYICFMICLRMSPHVEI